jgi:MFS superfamily sulfate permease-like transporter
MLLQILTEQFVKTVPAAALTAVTLLAGWLVTNHISANWDLYRKRRELDLAAVTQFYSTYGEFFAI